MWAGGATGSDIPLEPRDSSAVTRPAAGRTFAQPPLPLPSSRLPGTDTEFVMYQDFHRLRELPFELTPNPRYLFLTGQHREALSTLEYGLSSGKGLTLLIGEVGTGKTTLLRAALQSERCRHVTCVSITNPTLRRDEFIELLSVQFNLSAKAGLSKTTLLRELEASLRERRAQEAQTLPDELLEEVRLMANTETETEKLLPVVLAGQPELRDRLNQANLRQLKQRVTLSCEIAPFSQRETAMYIATRIRVAGGEAGRLFTREAVMMIHEHSRGIPRTVNVMCDNALLTAFALGRSCVDSHMVAEVVRDFDLGVVRYEYLRPSEEVPAEHEEAADDTRPTAITDTVPVPVPEPTQPQPVDEDRGPLEERPMFTSSGRRRFSLFGR
jgi:general secretion pathway protein A